MRHKVDRYDEDGMDDFIEDDSGDQGEIFTSDRHDGDADGRGWEVQLTEASEISEPDYLAFLQDDAGDEGGDDDDDDGDEGDLIGPPRQIPASV